MIANIISLLQFINGELKQLVALWKGDYLRLKCRCIYGKRVMIGERFRILGPMPIIKVALGQGGSIKIGNDCTLVNSTRYNLVGVLKTSSIVACHGVIEIGNDVGMSGVSIFSDIGITIMDSVKIGANCFIYDTDFHSIDAESRIIETRDLAAAAKVMRAPIFIHRNVFIGLGSMVLKGVVIGENTIVGAGTVVSKGVDANSVYVGAAARLINVKSRILY